MDRRTFLANVSLGAVATGFGSQLFANGMYGENANATMLTAMTEEPLTRFAFGSCNRSHVDQSYWRIIGQEAPQLWIWLGDNIYGDGMSMAERGAAYQALKANAYYSAFRSNVPIIGTWDDHDFASNNKDGTFAQKVDSKKLAMSFLDIPPSSPVVSRSGIYQNYVFGPVGQRTKVVLLDLRYNMYKSSKLILGDAQWQFLAGEVKADDYELLIIGSSLNVTSPSSGFGLEGWDAFASELRRLAGILATGGRPILLLSGDRHQGEFSRITLANRQPVYEFMSSGLTHYSNNVHSTPYRVGKPVNEPNFGVVEIHWGDLRPELTLTLKSPVGRGELQQIQATYGV